MEISPGVEIVWNLAGAETRASRMKEIEPDHFFCALLKIAEMNETEILSSQVPQMVVAALKAELDQLRKTLKEKSIDTTSTRREIRRAMGMGFLRIPDDEALHRSEASRQLFERAARTASQNKGLVDLSMLLLAILARPTPAMVKVLGPQAGKTEDAESGPREVLPAPDLSKNRFVQELPSLPASIPVLIEAAQTQVQVLNWALTRPNGKPICLIRDGRMDVKERLQRAVKKEPTHIQVLEVNVAEVMKGAKNATTVLTRIADILENANSGSANGSQKKIVFFDTVDIKIEKVTLLLRTLKPAFDSNTPRIVIAIQVSLFNQVIDDLQLDGLFQEIWLHELKESRVPHQL